MKQTQSVEQSTELASTSTCDVIFNTVPTHHDSQIGVVTLNSEASLNALNLEMAKAMFVQLSLWKQDPNIVCVVLQGAGEKAFCAGGDVRAIYQAGIQAPEEITLEALAFFEQEYRLDYLLHTFEKPVIAWGDGIVMGGGLGLMIAASHRIVTERSRVAMPEVTIGLYPDVGGSYFLNRMPGKVGLFLGLTAYQMNTADALYVGIGTHCLPSQNKTTLLDALMALQWNQGASAGVLHHNHQIVDALLNELHVKDDSLSVLKEQQQDIDALMAGELSEIVSRARNHSFDEAWLQKALHTFLKGSPLSWLIIYAQSQLSSALSLAEIFQFELGLSVNCSAFGDFKEGVRALLIDKDRKPIWQFSMLDADLTMAANRLLASPWEKQDHPLRHLSL